MLGLIKSEVRSLVQSIELASLGYHEYNPVENIQMEIHVDFPPGFPRGFHVEIRVEIHLYFPRGFLRGFPTWIPTLISHEDFSRGFLSGFPKRIYTRIPTWIPTWMFFLNIWVDFHPKFSSELQHVSLMCITYQTLINNLNIINLFWKNCFALVSTCILLTS